MSYQPIHYEQLAPSFEEKIDFGAEADGIHFCQIGGDPGYLLEFH